MAARIPALIREKPSSGRGLTAILDELEHDTPFRVREHGVVAEHAPEGALVEVDDSREPLRRCRELLGGVGVKRFDHSVAGHLLGCGNGREGFVHGSFEQMLPEPVGDRSAPGDLWVTFPEGVAAVPAPEPPLVPQQHGRVAASAIANASDVALVTRNIERSTVVARRAAGRSHLDLDAPVYELRIDDLEAVEGEGDADSIHRGASFLRWFGHRRS
jgi:hypothetical protein